MLFLCFFTLWKVYCNIVVDVSKYIFCDADPLYTACAIVGRSSCVVGWWLVRYWWYRYWYFYTDPSFIWSQGLG